MKKVIWVALAATTLSPVNAQLFSRESLSGAAVGGIIGGIIGHNSGRRTAEGVGIGAGAGLLLGALVESPQHETQVTAPTPVVAGPVYSYYPARPNYSITGAALGGLAGGIIGHNSGHKTAEGVAIGAGAGLVLGTLAEQNARRRETYVAPAPAYVLSPATRVALPPTPALAGTQTTAPAPQQRAVVNHSVGSPSLMSSANSLFGR